LFLVNGWISSFFLAIPFVFFLTGYTSLCKRLFCPNAFCALNSANFERRRVSYFTPIRFKQSFAHGLCLFLFRLPVLSRPFPSGLRSHLSLFTCPEGICFSVLVLFWDRTRSPISFLPPSGRTQPKASLFFAFPVF